MNKNAIKNFSVWARNKLIKDIVYKASMLGITENGIAKPLPQSTRDLQLFDVGLKDPVRVTGSDIRAREELVLAIQEKAIETNMKQAYEFIIEKVAYTWFNRLIAIRFMEVNDYLPSGIRVLSSEQKGKDEPDIVTAPFETDIPFTASEVDAIQHMKDSNRLDELFRMLFAKQCASLHSILPKLFDETVNYAYLLLSISFTDKEGIVYRLTHDIPENDFNVDEEGQVEIIGWLYQYYISEPKDALINAHKQYKYTDIPYVTQLFTPDWIVRYLVENSLGRLWKESHPNTDISDTWQLYLDADEKGCCDSKELQAVRAVYKYADPQSIKVIEI